MENADGTWSYVNVLTDETRTTPPEDWHENVFEHVYLMFERACHKFRAASYTLGRQDYAKLFRFYDRDNSGLMEYEEFRRGMRVDGQVTLNDMPDRLLRDMFDMVRMCLVAICSRAARTKPPVLQRAHQVSRACCLSAQVDSDHDGLISSEEFTHLLTVDQHHLLQMIKAYCLDHQTVGRFEAVPETHSSRVMYDGTAMPYIAHVEHHEEGKRLARPRGKHRRGRRGLPASSRRRVLPAVSAPSITHSGPADVSPIRLSALGSSSPDRQATGAAAPTSGVDHPDSGAARAALRTLEPSVVGRPPSRDTTGQRLHAEVPGAGSGDLPSGSPPTMLLGRRHWPCSNHPGVGERRRRPSEWVAEPARVSTPSCSPSPPKLSTCRSLGSSVSSSPPATVRRVGLQTPGGQHENELTLLGYDSSIYRWSIGQAEPESPSRPMPGSPGNGRQTRPMFRSPPLPPSSRSRRRSPGSGSPLKLSQMWRVDEKAGVVHRPAAATPADAAADQPNADWAVAEPARLLLSETRSHTSMPAGAPVVRLQLDRSRSEPTRRRPPPPTYALIPGHRIRPEQQVMPKLARLDDHAVKLASRRCGEPGGPVRRRTIDGAFGPKESEKLVMLNIGRDQPHVYDRHGAAEPLAQHILLLGSAGGTALPPAPAFGRRAVGGVAKQRGGGGSVGGGSGGAQQQSGQEPRSPVAAHWPEALAVEAETLDRRGGTPASRGLLSRGGLSWAGYSCM